DIQSKDPTVAQEPRTQGLEAAAAPAVAGGRLPEVDRSRSSDNLQIKIVRADARGGPPSAEPPTGRADPATRNRPPPSLVAPGVSPRADRSNDKTEERPAEKAASSPDRALAAALGGGVPSRQDAAGGATSIEEVVPGPSRGIELLRRLPLPAKAAL